MLCGELSRRVNRPVSVRAAMTTCGGLCLVLSFPEKEGAGRSLDHPRRVQPRPLHLCALCVILAPWSLEVAENIVYEC